MYVYPLLIFEYSNKIHKKQCLRGNRNFNHTLKFLVSLENAIIYPNCYHSIYSKTGVTNDFKILV